MSLFFSRIKLKLSSFWSIYCFALFFLSRCSFTLCNSIQCVNLSSVSFWQMLTHCLTSRISSIVDSTQKPKTLSFFLFLGIWQRQTYFFLPINLVFAIDLIRFFRVVTVHIEHQHSDEIYLFFLILMVAENSQAKKKKII